MSKTSELRLIRGQRSADAPINYHHRSGDLESSGGSMLDYYAQEESAEDSYFEEQEDSAREIFSRAFKLYLKKTLTGKERKFLSRVLSGAEKPQDVGREMGVKWFEYLQNIRRKAFNNAEAFGRVVQLSGWSRAEEFAGTVFARLRNLGKEAAELPKSKKQAQARAMMKAFRESAETERRTAENYYKRAWREAHIEQARASVRAWQKANREKDLERKRAWQKANREKARASARAWQEANREKVREYNRAWQEANREKVRAWQEANREKVRAWKEANREKIREYKREYVEANREKEREYNRTWREANREKIRENKRAWRAKKKAEKEAAKALAGLLVLSQTVETNTESAGATE